MPSSSVVGLIAKGWRAISSMSASQMEFPNTASGTRPITSLIACGFPLPLGIRITLSGYGAVLDFDRKGQNAFRRNAKMFHAGPDDPFAGGRHCPYFASVGVQVTYQRLHVGENPLGYFFLEERNRSAYQHVFRQSTIHGHHFGAHIVFADLACQVIGVAGASPGDNFRGDQAAAELPLKKACAGIARPQRSIAIKNCELRLELENRLVEFSSCQGRVLIHVFLARLVENLFRPRMHAALRSPRGCSHSW